MKSLSLFLLFLIISPQLKAQDQCQRLYRQLENTCNSYFDIKNSSLHSCLVRRDTCQTSTQEINAQKCQQVGLCMSANERGFQTVLGNNPSCEYYWSDEREICHIRKRPFQSRDHCPGRVSLGSTIIDGLDSGLDNSFDCDAQARSVERTLARCQEHHRSFQSQCPQFYQEVEENLPVPESYYLTRVSENWALEQAVGPESIDDSLRHHSPQDSPARPSSRPPSSARPGQTR